MERQIEWTTIKNSTHAMWMASFFVLMAYKLFLGYLMPKPFS